MDSLSKVRLVNTVRDKFNKEIPLEFLQVCLSVMSVCDVCL